MNNTREKIDIMRGGKVIDSAILSRNCPRATFYVELQEISSVLAIGQTKTQATMDAHRRAAQAFFDAATKRIHMIAQINIQAAEDLTNELRRFLTYSETEKEKPDRPNTNRRQKETTILCELYQAAVAVMDEFGGKLDENRPSWEEELIDVIAAPLDALALEDPEAATRVYEKFDFFQAAIFPDEVYLGHGIIADKSILKMYDTKEKRAAYISEINEE